RKSDSRREDANHRLDPVVYFQMRLRKILRRSEILPPVTIAHERDRRRSLLVITRRKIAAHDRLHTEYREKLRGHRGYGRARRLRASGDGNRVGRVLREGLK